MSTKKKLIDRFLSMPADFAYDELVRFVNQEEGKTFMMHRPHPDNKIKLYVMKQVLEYLSKNSDIIFKDEN